MFDLSGKTALVTGATGGLGGAIARTLHAQGATVMLSGTRVEALEALARELDARCHVQACNLAKQDEVEALVPAAEAAMGSLDILVNNAARAIGGVVDEIDEDSWNEVLSTNLTSVWRGMKAAIPEMKKRGGGAIVNLSSVQALTGFRGWAAYAAAKGGINALTQQTAVDLAPHRIRVNAVAPGTIMTPLNEAIFRQHPDPDSLIRTWNEAHPLGRFGQPEEVAEAVLFLAGPRSSFMTGTIVRVDGGLLVKGE